MNKTERLDILVQGEVISLQVRKLAEEFIKKLEEIVGIDWESETSMLFVTHLSVALQRMANGVPIEEIPEEVKSQIDEKGSVYVNVVTIINKLQASHKVSLTCSNAEILFLAAYISIIQKK